MCRFIQYIVLYASFCAPYNVVRESTGQVIKCTAMLIAEAENEIKRLTNETENIDS